MRARNRVSEPTPDPVRYRPTKEEVEGLIERAARHPLGLDFLKHGAINSVSAVFQTHAFVVDRARDSMARQRLRQPVSRRPGS